MNVVKFKEYKMESLNKIITGGNGLDSLANYIGDIPEKKWYVVMTRSRDSDILTESNWSQVENVLPEGENVEIFRFGHWACGWWEAYCVAENTPEYDKGEELYDSMQDYPVLNEDDFFKRESEASNEVWRDCYSVEERIEYIRDNDYQFEFNSFSEMLAVVRGEYFIGYASELI